MNAPPDMNAMKALSSVDSHMRGGEPVDLVVLVLPGFSQLALHAFIEPFRIANVLSKLALFRWRIGGLDAGPVMGASGLSVAVDMTVDDLDVCIGRKAPNHFAIIAGDLVSPRMPQITNVLRTFARRGIPISALGTAPWLLAQTGLLSGRRCTIHWSKLAAFSEMFQQTQARDALFIKDGQFATCAGELAAFDLAVDLISGHVNGTIAQEICRYATVDGQRSGSNRQTGPSGLAFAGASAKLLMAMRIMEEYVENPLSMAEVSQRVGISRRQLERLFSAHVGMPPVRHYLRVRVEHAKRLIEGSSLPIIDIAMACGFMSASHFAKAFRTFHGVSPQQCRIALPAWVGPGLG